MPSKPDTLFGWEIAHRDDERRKSRKYFQLLIDEIVFCISGCASLVIFWLIVPKPVNLELLYLIIIEGIFLLILGIWIIIYADLRKGRSK